MVVSEFTNMAARVASKTDLNALGDLKIKTNGSKIADRISKNLKDADIYERAANATTDQSVKDMWMNHCNAAIQKVKNVLIKAKGKGNEAQKKAIDDIQNELSFKKLESATKPFEDLKKSGNFTNAKHLDHLLNTPEKADEGEGIQWGPVVGGIAAGGATGAVGAHYLWSKKPKEDKAEDAAKTDDKAAPADAKKADDKASPADAAKTDDKADPSANNDKKA